MDWLLNGMAQLQGAKWDAWELVEDHTREQVEQAYRDALFARGVYTVPQRGIDLTIAELVDGFAASHTTEQLTRWASRRATPMDPEARRRARDAVQSRAAGLTRDQVRTELAAEYTAHGIREIDAADLSADTVRIRPPALGERLAGLGALARGARAVVNAVRNGQSYDPDDPEDRARVQREGEAEDALHDPPAWVTPPARAVELDDDGPLTAVRVDLDPDGPGVLARLGAEWATAHPNALIHPWLSADPDTDGPDHRVRVHLGDQTIGHLPTRPGTPLSGQITAATGRDEAVSVNGLLTGTGIDPAPWVLRVTVPRTPAPEG